jgi:hypothetical protein
MNHVTTAVIYQIPILQFDCVKKFINEAAAYSKKHNKGAEWVKTVLHDIRCGLKVTFIHVWDTDDKDMVFQTYLSFYTIDSEMYPMGEFCVKDVNALQVKYESNPDFIFEQLDWDSPKEKIIEEFLNDLKKMRIATI